MNHPDTDLRNYHTADEKVKENYYLARKNQSLKFVVQQRNKFQERIKKRMSIWEAFDLIDQFVDLSDPDINLSNLHHLLQTAEAMRKNGEPDWMQLTGLIHDLGKIMHIFGSSEEGTSMEKQWAIVGDTFIVGCQLPDSLVYPEFNSQHPDVGHPIYDTPNGMYQSGCGLDNVMCTWGHDEYLYQVLRNNQCPLPEEGYYLIRYHSLYPWHDKGSYSHLTNQKDKDLLPLLKRFNSYDLYTKENVEYNWEKLKEYYGGLIKKYLTSDGYLEW